MRVVAGVSHDDGPRSTACTWTALPPATLTVDAGGHTNDYWRDHGGDQLRWVRQQLDRQ